MFTVRYACIQVPTVRPTRTGVPMAAVSVAPTSVTGSATVKPRVTTRPTVVSNHNINQSYVHVIIILLM